MRFGTARTNRTKTGETGMKKILGMTFGGLQKRAILLVALMLLLLAVMFAGITVYQNRMLLNVVAETRVEQQGAISETSKATMHQVMEGSLVSATELKANLADNDFAEIVSNTRMLQTMAEGVLQNRDSLTPLSVELPDAKMDGTSSAFVLFEQGVDYTQSDYLGYLAHLSTPMIALHQNSQKIDGCYIGLIDGTDLCVDDKAKSKLTESDEPIPFPVRERPWYLGAMESGDLYFTGITVDVLSNSEQRFLSYKSIASKGEDFERTIETGTAIVDVGGGSIQLSLFDKDTLVTTTNLLLGSLRVSGRIAQLENQTAHPDVLIDQLIRKDILNFKRMYLKDRNIDTIILVGDYFTNLIFQNRADANKFESREEFLGWYDKIVNMTAQEAAEFLGVGMEVAHAVLPTAVLYKRLIEVLGVKTVWLPGIQLTDGIAFDYGLSSKIIRSSHDFDRDILSAARNIMKRYAGNKPHTDKLLEVSDEIFRAVRKSNLLSDRDRLLLKVACCLHDCGKYISMTNLAECSYNIIKSTEIIGISQVEQEIVACVVRFNHEAYSFKKLLAEESALEPEDCMTIARLTAILRVANALDRSHRQKFDDLQIRNQDGKMFIMVETGVDISLEKGLFSNRADFFEEVFGIRPVIKQKKR